MNIGVGSRVFDVGHAFFMMFGVGSRVFNVGHDWFKLN
jgi:hypothetical protein